MYLPASSRIGNERILDVSKLKYTYRWGDMDAALADNERGANYLKSQSIAIYPDTTVWVKDFHFAYNEPLFEQYFWHKAYKNYPVVGVTWDQARAYCNFRSKLKTDYNESLKEKTKTIAVPSSNRNRMGICCKRWYAECYLPLGRSIFNG